MSSAAFDKTKQEMVQPFGRTESDGLLREVSRDIVSFQIVVQACEPEQNRMIRWPQLPSLLHSGERTMQVSGIDKRLVLLDELAHLALGFSVLLRFFAQLD